MKKFAALMGLVALAALPACSNQRDASDHQYRAHGEDNREYARDGGRGDWQEHKEQKLQAMTDYAFAKADTNRDGYISRAELDAFTRKMFREADTNHDGKLSRDEVLAQKRKEMDDMHSWMDSKKSDNTANDGVNGNNR